MYNINLETDSWFKETHYTVDISSCGFPATTNFPASQERGSMGLIGDGLVGSAGWDEQVPYRTWRIGEYWGEVHRCRSEVNMLAEFTSYFCLGVLDCDCVYTVWRGSAATCRQRKQR